MKHHLSSKTDSSSAIHDWRPFCYYVSARLNLFTGSTIIIQTVNHMAESKLMWHPHTAQSQQPTERGTDKNVAPTSLPCIIYLIMSARADSA